MDITMILEAFQNISIRLKRLEDERLNIKIPEKGIDYFDGADGKDGANGRDGKDGKDFTFDMFTPEQLKSLTGERGIAGKNGKNGLDGKNGKDGINGINGKDGLDGKDGKDGKNGRDGRGIADAYIDESGHLIIVFTDGTKKDVGKVTGKDGASGVGMPGMRGKEGVGVLTASINNKGNLIITLTDGREIDAGQVSGGGQIGGIVSDTIKTIWTGTKEEFNSLTEYDKETLYFVCEPGTKVFYQTIPQKDNKIILKTQSTHGETELSVVVSGKEYDANNISTNKNSPDGTIIVGGI